MHSNKPKMAKEWEAHTPPGKLPEHVKPKPEPKPKPKRKRGHR
jgi:hypothetical protein